MTMNQVQIGQLVADELKRQGQSVLKRLGKIEIDNERRVLKITTNK